MPDISFFLPLVLQSAVTPFVVALAVLAVCRALPRVTDASLIALATGFIASYFMTLHAQWSLVPKVALDSLPWIVAAGAVAAFLAERISHGPARIAARLVPSLMAGGLAVWPALGSLGAQKAALAVTVIGLVVTAVWSVTARRAPRPAPQPLLLAVVAGGTGVALMLDSSQSIGQLGGALAAALAACLVFTLPRLRMAFVPAAAGLAVLVLGTLLATAHVYAGFSLGYVTLLAGALMVDPIVSALRKGKVGWSWVPATVLTAIPVAVTVALAVKAAQDSGGY